MGWSPAKNPATPGCGRGRFAGSPPEPSKILGGFPSDSCGARLGPRPPRSGRVFFDGLLGAQVRLEEAQDAAPGVLRRGLVVADAGHPQDRAAGAEIVPVEERVARVRVLADVALDARAVEARVERRRGPAQGLVLPAVARHDRAGAVQ